MTVFRLFLACFLLVLLVYTVIVATNHGTDLFSVFFGDMLAMNWPGQFNLDFMGFLMLSGLWVVWRNDFTPVGWVLGVFAFLGGMTFLPVYLLFLSFKTNGDMAQMFFGQQLEKHVAAL